MIESEFVNELYYICQKYKKNINVKVETDESGISHYEVDITGAWPIRMDCDAVVVTKVQNSTFEYSIKGDK
jgi:hypothetical protein